MTKCQIVFDNLGGINYSRLRLSKAQLMELLLRKFGNSTGLTLPPAILRELGFAEGQVVTVNKTPEGGLLIQPKRQRKKYTASELNALCNPKAPMPDDLVAWGGMKPVGSEAW
jgi:antitoxin ChpS